MKTIFHLEGLSLKRTAVTAAAVTVVGHLLGAREFTGVLLPDVGTSLPLLQRENLVYAGAFRVPNGQTDAMTFDYGGTALAYRPETNTLMAASLQMRVAEFSIPVPVISNTLASLPQAAFVQPFTDVLAGLLGPLGYEASIGGLLPLPMGRLIVSGYSAYDGGGTVSHSHFTTGLDFSHLPPVGGPYQVYNSQAGFVGGYMMPIPAAFQAALGGPYLTGQCCISIISRTSSGPSVTVFDPAQLGVTNPVPGTRLLGYDDVPGHRTLGDDGGVLFNATAQVGGAVFPEGTRTILFIGRNGTPPFHYGIGTSDPVLNGTLSPGCTVPESCSYWYDPSAVGAHGYLGYPYKYFVWAYDVNDLIAVKNGKKRPWEPVPYATWTFELSFAPNGRQVFGVAYDPQRQRLFVSQDHGDGHGPLIHVFTIVPNSGSELGALGR